MVKVTLRNRTNRTNRLFNFPFTEAQETPQPVRFHFLHVVQEADMEKPLPGSHLGPFKNPVSSSKVIMAGGHILGPAPATFIPLQLRRMESLKDQGASL